jgi:hypothetical protein
MQFGDFREQVASLKLRNCVIVLYEVPTTTEIVGATQTISFMRSLCRAAGLVTVLMGTDSTVANLIAGPTHTRVEKHGQQIWSFIITDLPATNYTLLVERKYNNNDPLLRLTGSIHHQYLYECLRSHLHNCRPLLVMLVLDAVLRLHEDPLFSTTSSLELLQKLSVLVAHDVKSAKRADNYHRDFLNGQIAMLSAAYSEHHTRGQLQDPAHRLIGPTSARTCADSLFVNRHLFMPLCSTNTIYIDNDRLCNKTGEHWVAMSCLAQKEAPLLTLFMSTPSDAFTSSRRADKSMLALFSDVTTNEVRTTVVCDNPQARTVSGSWLEFLSSSVVVRASHGRFTGTPPNEFIFNVLREFGLDLTGGVPDLRALCNNTSFAFPGIPFYLPSAADFNIALDVFAPLIAAGLRLDQFNRTCNKDEVDGRSTHVVLECKDHAAPLTVDTLKDIITRFAKYPEQHLFFIVCNKTQDSYFKFARSKGVAAVAAAADEQAKRPRRAAKPSLPRAWSGFLAEKSVAVRTFVQETQFLTVRQSELQPLLHFQHLLVDVPTAPAAAAAAAAAATVPAPPLAAAAAAAASADAVVVKRVVIVIPLALTGKR